ncbi:MAG TPA: D-aminoacyl-tRNA deacylase [Planctomycetota bacterium]|nr:D-aminoacyl-tRNA deacylase [Planctomycetota bacterium]
MRALLQRVSSASVTVDGQIVGQIGRGLLVLLGIHKDDTASDGERIAKKILQARIFEDDAGKMNLCVSDIKGELLIVSQFTLYGDLSKGTRPSFSDSMPGEAARAFYADWVTKLRAQCPLKIEEGRFAATMQVSLVNEGPVTLMLDSRV